jgi:hypothetical protein
MFAAQERRAQRFAHRVVPVRGLVVTRFVLHGDGSAPMFDGVGPLAVRCGDARIARIYDQSVKCAPVVVHHSERHARREFFVSRFRGGELGFGLCGLALRRQRAAACVLPRDSTLIGSPADNGR